MIFSSIITTTTPVETFNKLNVENYELKSINDVLALPKKCNDNLDGVEFAANAIVPLKLQPECVTVSPGVDIWEVDSIISLTGGFYETTWRQIERDREIRAVSRKYYSAIGGVIHSLHPVKYTEIWAQFFTNFQCQQNEFYWESVETICENEKVELKMPTIKPDIPEPGAYIRIRVRSRDLTDIVCNKWYFEFHKTVLKISPTYRTKLGTTWMKKGHILFKGFNRRIFLE